MVMYVCVFVGLYVCVFVCVSVSRVCLHTCVFIYYLSVCIIMPALGHIYIHIDLHAIKSTLETRPCGLYQAREFMKGKQLNCSVLSSVRDGV